VTPQDTDTDTDTEKKDLSEASSDVPVPKPRRKTTDYHPEFLAFVAAYPFDPGMSRPEALKAWEKLSPEDRDKALKAIPAFKDWVSKQGKDYRTVHACRYLSQRRFEGFVEAEASVSVPKQVQVFVGTPQWAAWTKHRGKPPPETDIRLPDGIKRGWYFETEWPAESRAA
jgi:hypothetical protein